METEAITTETTAAEEVTAEITPEPLPAEAEAPETPSPAFADETTAVESAPDLPEKSSAEALVDEFRRLEELNKEYSQFRELFPDMSISELPDEVLDSVKGGVPLTAACALYKLRRTVAAAKATAVNESNEKLSSGDVKKAPVNYLTIEEIREMSPGEVKNNYPLILESLKNQNIN